MTFIDHYCDTCSAMTEHDMLGSYRECIACGAQVAPCEACGEETDDVQLVQIAHATMTSPAEYEERCGACRRLPSRLLTRAARLAGMADAGVDTWEGYRGEA